MENLLKLNQEINDTTTKRKKELINGVIYLHATPTHNHGRISTNLIFEIKKQLPRTSNCEVYSDSISYKINEKNEYIPDITLICNAGKDNEKTHLIIEIWSKSNKKKHREDKIEAYAKLGITNFIEITHYNKNYKQHILENGIYKTIKEGIVPMESYFVDMDKQKDEGKLTDEEIKDYLEQKEELLINLKDINITIDLREICYNLI